LTNSLIGILKKIDLRKLVAVFLMKLNFKKSYFRQTKRKNLNNKKNQKKNSFSKTSNILSKK
jgi:hypothetical protein